jgi:hypothetical protein
MESSNGSEGTTLKLSMSIRSRPDRIASMASFDQPNNAYGHSVAMVKQGLAYGRSQQVGLLSQRQKSKETGQQPIKRLIITPARQLDGFKAVG